MKKKKFRRPAKTFWRDKKHRDKKGKPKVRPVTSKQFVPRKVFVKVKGSPDWDKRPGYFLERGQVHEAVFEDGRMKAVEDGIIVPLGDSSKGYVTEHNQTCPELSPSKLVQRKELAKKAAGGTTLELYAGKGNLSENVYAETASNLVMVDKNKALLDEADKRLKGKVQHETIASDNVEWLKNEMPNAKNLRKVTLTDFDAFGSPAKPMRTFFKHFPIKRKMYVALTDGSKIFLGYKKGSEARKWLRQEYGILMNPKGTREDQVRILDAFMKANAQVYNFNVRPINVAFGKHHAVYAGYEISPK